VATNAETKGKGLIWRWGEKEPWMVEGTGGVIYGHNFALWKLRSRERPRK
jgi:hypothetical protein